MAEIAQIEAGARLTVDLGAIIANYRTLCARAPGAVCAPVVKADAYGLGAAGVVPALLEAGADLRHRAEPEHVVADEEIRGQGIHRLLRMDERPDDRPVHAEVVDESLLELERDPRSVAAITVRVEQE